MKIKKYIAAIVLAMSLTTGLVFANAKGNDVLKTHVLAFNFKGANMPEHPKQAFEESSKDKPFPLKNETTAANFIYLVMYLDQLASEYDINSIEKLYSDHNGVYNSFLTGIEFYDHDMNDANVKKLKKAVKEADVKKTENDAITEEKFAKAKEKAIDVMEKEEQYLKRLIKRNEEVLELFRQGDKEGASKLFAKRLKEEFGNNENFKDVDFEENAKDIDEKYLENSIKIFKEQIENIEYKLNKLKDVQFENVNALKGKFYLEKELFTLDK